MPRVRLVNSSLLAAFENADKEKRGVKGCEGWVLKFHGQELDIPHSLGGPDKAEKDLLFARAPPTIRLAKSLGKGQRKKKQNPACLEPLLLTLKKKIIVNFIR